MDPVKAYIYTIPKAGTYLASTFLDSLGIVSTGWHIAANKYLDTKSFDEVTNKHEPSKTMVQQSYIDTFKKVPRGSHAFGHFNPLYIAPGILRQYKVIGIKRQLKEVLISEFIDFRYRRRDVALVSKESISDPIKAFEVYLQSHAPVIKNIAHNFLLLERISRNRDFRSVVGENRFLFVDFKSFLDSYIGPEIAFRIATFLGCELEESYIEKLRLECLMADNKTKSDDVRLDFERESLWTSTAEEIYIGLGMRILNQRLGYA